MADSGRVDWLSLVASIDCSAVKGKKKKRASVPVLCYLFYFVGGREMFLLSRYVRARFWLTICVFMGGTECGTGGPLPTRLSIHPSRPIGTRVGVHPTASPTPVDVKARDDQLTTPPG